MGGPVGVSIVKALRLSALKPRIVGTDADPLSVGLFRTDAAHVLPHVTVDEAGYVARLREICLAERVAMVCFGSEIEMRRLAPHLPDFERETGTTLILNCPEFVETFMDKWEMVGLLREKGLPAPDSALATDPAAVEMFLDRHTFPLILKPSRGSGSQGVSIVGSRAELDFLSRHVSEPMIQEYLLPDDEEYTVGVYKSPRTGYVGQIVLKRQLSAGWTYKAQVVRDEQIESVCRRVVEAFDVWGPINLQVRKTAAGVQVFEINLRFSGSAVIRAYFGFNEPEMCLRDVIHGEPLSQPEVSPGYAFRYWDEIYLKPGEYPADPAQPHPLEPGGTKADNF